MPVSNVLVHYADEVRKLVTSDTAAEESYYPAIKSLLTSLLKERNLPGDVRVNTRERRSGGGVDRPDLAIYDGSGDFILVGCETKLPDQDVLAIAASESGNSQVGRYLAKSKVVIVTNVRSLVLVTAPDWRGTGPVPPTERTIGVPVELWPSTNAMRSAPAAEDALAALADLVEEAVTGFAPIAEPESLARVLARQARRAKAAMPQEFGQAVKGLAEDFGNALGITFEGEEGEEFFRSSLVQTVFYGLFAAWTLWQRSGAKEEFRWRDVPEHLKIPFLGDLFHEIQLPSRIKNLGLAVHLDQAEATLERVDVGRFFAKMTPPNLSDDAEAQAASSITYFYEPFLEAFDPELRKQLGVWYTPPEIVKYQVRKVDQLLRDELKFPLGLADERVVILDPCCGTGAYLMETLHAIAETLRGEGVGAELGDRLRAALTQRVIGFEILTAPFVIAHLQLYLLLQSMNAEPLADERLAVFLTNALTGWDGKEQLKINFPELKEERDAAQKVKTGVEVIVVIGNPPYNRFSGAAMDEEADLVDHYKGIKRDSKGKQVGKSELFTKWKVRKHLLDDLYVRFFRLAEKRIGERAKYGIVSFISNNRYLSGKSFPIMRESLLGNFDEVWVDNLHGYRQASERTPWGTTCETTFAMESSSGIKVGTAIATYLKRGESPTRPALVNVRDFHGRASAKRHALLVSLTDPTIKLSGEDRVSLNEDVPQYESFNPESAKRWKMVPYEALAGYEDWPALDELFARGFQGVNPNRGVSDSLIDFDSSSLVSRMRDYYSNLDWDTFKARHPELALNRARYEAKSVRSFLNAAQGETGLPRATFDPTRVVPYLMFPLDCRLIYYESQGKLLNERRSDLWENLDSGEFLALEPEPRRPSAGRPLLCRTLFDLHVHEGGSVGFPATLHKKGDAQSLFDETSQVQVAANITATGWLIFKGAYGLHGDSSGGDAKALVSKLFRLALAAVHSPSYELEHGGALRQDWPHLPIPKDKALLDELAVAGDKVAILLDPLADPREIARELLGDWYGKLAVVSRTPGAAGPADYTISYSYFASGKGRWEPKSPPVEDWPAAWGDQTGDLYLNSTTFLANVPEKIWRYELGGYPVIKKWLGYRDAKRRPGKPLTQEELAHLRSIVQRLAALHILHQTLDELYERIGENCFTAEELGLR